jgi:hypothetical protein
MRTYIGTALPLFSWGWGEVKKMLGDLVYEGRGKVVGMRVLENFNQEITGVLQGMFLGEEFTATFSYTSEFRMDGTGYGAVRGYFGTNGGSVGRFVGNGNAINKLDGSSIIRGALCYSNPPGKFAKLNGIAVAYEFEADKEGNLHSKGWEWK